MKTKTFILMLMAAVLGLTACTSYDQPVVNPTPTPPTPDTPIQPEPDYESVMCNDAVFVSYGIDQVVRTAMESYLTDITAIDNADVAVVKSEDIGTYEGELKALYDRGGLIVVARPTGDHFKEFAEKYNITNMLPIESTQPILLFATDNNHHHYVLYANGPFDGTYNDEDVTTISPVKSTGEEIKEPTLEDEQTYYKRRVFEFFRWIKQHRKDHADTRSATWTALYDPYIYFVECEHIRHNYEVAMNHEVCHVLFCSKDYINTTGSIDVNYQIYTAYFFGGESQHGDYYIVTRDVTVHNDDAYNPYDVWHGGVLISVAGYYMKEFDITTKLVDMRNHDLNDVVFAKDPTPGTTINSTSYTSGFTLGFDGAVSVGTDTGGSLGFGAGYDHSVTKDISDLEIQKVTDSQSRAVTHKYIVKNLFSGLDDGWFAWDSYTKMESKIPGIARSDFDATSEWCWFVPAGTNDVDDNKTTSFYLYNIMTYGYGCKVRSDVGDIYNDTHSYSATGGSIFAISAPNRTPFGVLALQNTHANTIGDVHIWGKGQDPAKDQPFTTMEFGILADSIGKIALPVGDYYLEYTQKDKNNKKLSTWKIEDIEIKPGNTESSATTNKTTINDAVLLIDYENAQ